MAILSQLRVDVHAPSGGYPQAELRAQLVTSPLAALRAALDFDELGEALTPPSRRSLTLPQAIYSQLRARVAGRGLITTDDFVGGWEGSLRVGLTPGGDWRLTLPSTTDGRDHGPLGWPDDYAGHPPPGPCSVVEMQLVYVVPTTGAQLAYIAFSGFAAQSVRRFEPQEGDVAPRRVIEIEGLGPEAQLDRREISYQRPANHRLRHGDLIHDVAALAGLVVDIPRSLGYRLRGRIEIDEEPAWPVLVELLLAAGHWPVWDGSTLSSVEIAPLAGDSVATVEWEDLLAAGGWREDADADQPVEVIIEGQSVQPPDGADGTVTRSTSTRTFSNFAKPLARFSQSNSSPFVFPIAGGGFAPAKLLETSRIEREETYEEGCLVLIRTTTWGWGNRRAARYQTDTLGEINLRRSGYLYDEGVTDGDQADLRVWPQHRFRVESIVEEAILRSGGVEYAREHREALWRNLARHLKEAAGATGQTDWSAEPHKANLPVLGSRAGVVWTEDRFMAGPSTPLQGLGGFNPTTNRQLAWAKFERVDVGVDSANLVSSRRRVSQGYGLRKGGRYWYAEDKTSQDDQERGLILETELEVYEDAQEGSHSKVTETRDVDGELSGDGIKVETVAGGRPRADVCDEESVALSTSQTVRGRRRRPVPACQQSIPLVLSSRFTEDVAAAGELAGRILRWLAAPTITVQIPATAPLTGQLGRRIGYRFGPAGMVGAGWIESVRHYQQPREDGRAWHGTEITIRRQL